MISSRRRFQSNSLIGPLYKFQSVFSDVSELSHDFNRYNSYRQRQVAGNIIGVTVISGSIVAEFVIDFSGSSAGIVGVGVIVIGGGALQQLGEPNKYYRRSKAYKKDVQTHLHK